MRTIKFRAWDGERMLTGLCNMFFFNRIAIDEEVMQYIGLQDSNNIDSFEGDIIYSDNMFFQNKPLIIKFEDGCFIAVRDKDHNMRGLSNLAEQPFEIIGNVHQNPGLLK